MSGARRKNPKQALPKSKPSRTGPAVFDIDLSTLTNHGTRAATDRHFQRIPWLETSSVNQTKSLLPVSVRFRNPTTDKRHLVVAMGNAVPIYLPAKYHQMRWDIPKHAKLTAALKMQWDAAFEFFHTCNTHDHNYMAKVFKDVKTLGKKMPAQKPSKFKASSQVQQCQNAAEFLLEPWVLIQMPFQPALLHQWALALLAEALLFQKKISPIFSYGFPEKFNDLADCLREMLFVMKSCADNALHMYTHMCSQGDEMNLTATLIKHLTTFSNEHLSDALPVIEFVTSKETNSIIWAIEKLFLHELNGDAAHPPQVVFDDLDDEPTPLYDFWFWTTECDLDNVFAGVERAKDTGNKQLLLFASSKDEEHACTLDSCACLSMKKLTMFMCDRMLFTKRLSGIDLDTLMAVVQKKNIAKDVLPHICYIAQFMKDKNCAEVQKKTDNRVLGALDDLISLYADVKMSEDFDLLARRIFDMVKKVHPGVILDSSVVCPKNTTKELALTEIVKKYENILSMKDWTWGKILSDARSTCGTVEEITATDIDKHTAKVIQHYQTRIRKLVYNMAAKHFTSLQASRFEYFPEHQVVQYLLPFFVNCILSVHTNSPKSRKTKRKCVRFVEQLIFSYEQYEYRQVLSTLKKVEIQNRDKKLCDFYGHSRLFTNMLAEFLNDKEVCSSIIPTLEYFFLPFENEWLEKFALQEIGESVENSKWFMRMDMFMRRAIHILKEFNNSTDACLSEAFLLSGYIDHAFNFDDNFSISIYTIYSQSVLQGVDFHTPLRESLDNKDIKDLKLILPKDIVESAKQLSCQQLAALFVFLHFRNAGAAPSAHWERQLQGPGFPFDMSSVFIWSAATNDRWKIKQLVVPMLMIKSRRAKKLIDASFVSLDVLKSNKCYKPVLGKISPDGTKVLMKEKGEITFVPVKHCRWCGLIKAEKFQMCALCKEFVEYCDVNYFCSEKCELEALALKHREEHARYYEVKLGFE